MTGIERLGCIGKCLIWKYKIMLCKLCQQEKELCRSHIIPETAYGPLYDNMHRFFEVTNTQEGLSPLQKGLRERLLCRECEKYLNKYDSYFADMWYQKGKAPTEVNKEIIAIDGLDYHRFKLFHISVLWRAGIASRDEFREVALAHHERSIRDLILADDPGEGSQYAIFAYVLTFPKDKKVLQGLVTQPFPAELNGVKGFHFIFGGCLWHYVLASSINLKEYWFIFRPNSPLYLLPVTIDQYKPVMDLMKKRRDCGW